MEDIIQLNLTSSFCENSFIRFLNILSTQEDEYLKLLCLNYFNDK